MSQLVPAAEHTFRFYPFHVQREVALSSCNHCLSLFLSEDSILSISVLVAKEMESYFCKYVTSQKVTHSSKKQAMCAKCGQALNLLRSFQ